MQTLCTDLRPFRFKVSEWYAIDPFKGANCNWITGCSAMAVPAVCYSLIISPAGKHIKNLSSSESFAFRNCCC